MSDHPERNPWKRVSARHIYKNPWISVTEHQVIRPDGEEGIYGVIDTRIATGVVPLTDDLQTYLVGQYRFPTEMYSWEIPEGGADHGEEPLEAIKRELREEAGLTADHWEQLGGEIHLSNCVSSERGFLYVARGLTEVSNDPEGTEILQVRKLPLREALQLVDDGVIVDAISIIALLRVARKLGIGH